MGFGSLVTNRHLPLADGSLNHHTGERLGQMANQVAVKAKSGFSRSHDEAINPRHQSKWPKRTVSHLATLPLGMRHRVARSPRPPRATITLMT